MRYAFAGCTLDTDLHALTRDGVRVDVEPQVFDLIALLAASGGRLVTKDEIVAAVWQGRAVSESAISARIASARKAVGDDGEAQAVIRTVARRGLQLVAAVRAEEGAAPPARPRQTIRYTTAPDGTRLAYALAGEGPMVLHLPAGTETHLELYWNSPVHSPRYHAVIGRYTLLRTDARGSGLSDRAVGELTADTRAGDLAAVLDASGWTRGAIWAESGAVAEAVRLATTFPDKVSCLILQGGYVHGRSVREGAAEGAESIETMLREGWGKPGSAFMEAFLAAYLPEMSQADRRHVAATFHDSSSVEVALQHRRLANRIDISGLLDKVRAPTLILHSRGDAVHPVSEAGKLAAGIPGAELVVLESRNAVMIPADPVFPDYVAEVTGFLDRHA